MVLGAFGNMVQAGSYLRKMQSRGLEPTAVSTGSRWASYIGGPRSRCNHPEVDRLWGIHGMHYGSCKDHILRI